MTSWDEFAAAEPDFAGRVRRLFTARKHMTMATLRRDGSPRISGTEVEFADGELWLGMMPGSRKALDLRRDPRLAVHGPSVDADQSRPEEWPGEVKVAGRGVEVGDPQGTGEPHRFRVELGEVVLTRVEADLLVVESWHPGRGYEVRRRT
ncbi:MAG TPA: pyridoxamine 5'-phosphate oxidase family protein [Mycobacteriales bacterium]